jgi:alkylation response protein AidB-like acyl-CoA dehydrogenase
MARITEEQLEIRAMAREVAEAELRPGAERWDAAGELPMSILETLGELGFFGLEIPEAHGGLATDPGSALMALEALAWGDGSVALSVAVHAGPVSGGLVRYGSPQQQSVWLPALADGSVLAGTPVAGGASAVAFEGSLVARSEGDGWVLDGVAPWVVNGSRAGLILVFASIQGDAGGEPLPLLLDPTSPGITRTPSPRTMGFTASDTATLTFSEVRCGPEARLGARGTGESVQMACATAGQLAMAALALGIGDAALDHAVRYATERVQFGTPLSGFGGIQEKLAGAAIELAQARALLLDVVPGASGEASGGGPETLGLHGVHSLRMGAAMAKVAASSAAMRSADEAVQIHGGYGYMRDYPVERLMRDAKGTELLEGSNERLRTEIAQTLVQRSTG